MNISTHRAGARPRAGLAATVLLLALGAAACGSNTSAAQEVASLGTDAPAGTATDGTATADTATADTATADSAPTDPEDAMLAYAQCMRDHGVDMPDPQVDASGNGVIVISGESGSNAAVPAGTGMIGPDPTFDAAQEACQPIMDAVVSDVEIDPAVLAEQREQMLDFAQCMREHGIDMPDPVFDDNGGVSIQVGVPGDAGTGPALDDDAWQEANAACSELIGGPGMPSVVVGDDNSGATGIVVGGAVATETDGGEG